jgi:double-stranded uracil-DNA glycosylase
VRRRRDRAALRATRVQRIAGVPDVDSDPARSFAPIAAADAHVLVLGSLPGRASLARGEYYAQPRNAFWTIMGTLLGFEPSADYAQRQRALIAARVALWDVCAAAVRAGSLDSAIRRDTVVPNDLRRFLQAHDRIGQICFNGATAATLYVRCVLPTLSPAQQAIPRVILPSTSPAHAALRFEAKREQWARALALTPPAEAHTSLR